MDKKPKLRLVVNNTKAIKPDEIASSVKQAVEEKLAANGSSSATFKTVVKFKINGQEYDSVENIPADVKQVLEKMGLVEDPTKPKGFRKIIEPTKGGFFRWFLFTLVLAGAAWFIKSLIK